MHKVGTLDAQPSNENGGILVMVTGALLVGNTQVFSEHSLYFSSLLADLLGILRSTRSNGP